MEDKDSKTQDVRKEGMAPVENNRSLERDKDAKIMEDAERALNEMRASLGLTDVKVSERDRTDGVTNSILATAEMYASRITNSLQAEVDALNNALGRDDILSKMLENPRYRGSEWVKSSPVVKDMAIRLALQAERELDRKIISGTTLTEQVDAICASLDSRTELCNVCQSAAEQLANYLHDRRLGNPTNHDDFWPKRDLSGHTLAAFLDGIRLLPPEKVEPGDRLPSNVIRHHPEAGSLLKSAKHCSFCELIRIAIILDSNRKYGFPLDRPKEDLISMITFTRLGGGGEIFSKILEGIRNSKESIHLMIEMNDRLRNGNGFPWVLGNLRVIWQKSDGMIDEDSKDRKVVFTKLNVFTSIDSDLVPYISTRQPLHNSGSPNALSQLKQWLTDCKSHSFCRKTISHHIIPKDELYKLPTRVIDVGSRNTESDPYLVETHSHPEGCWVALSHCWGGKENHPLKTTRETLKQHLESISMASLPKTFRDAVIVTRALGLRYLWIDSLCIVQDDKEDWQRESQMMGTIYERAILTLAASAARDSTHGLFVERPYAKIAFPSVQLPFTVRTVDTGLLEMLGEFSIGLDWRQEPFMEHMDPILSPLAQRGWCTQELILSRRIVHFLEEGMVWVCKNHAEDETGQMIIGRNLTEGDWATEWGRIIVEHSAREFTFEKDRLVSLEGLAGKTCEAENNSCRPGTYFFGTWEADIPEYILWASYRRSKKNPECPSWSWASCGGPVWLRFRDFDNNRQDEGFGRSCEIFGIDKDTGVLSLEAKKFEIDGSLLSKMKRVPMEDFVGEKAKLAYRQPLIQGYEIGGTEGNPYGWIEFDDDRDVHQITTPTFFLHLGSTEYWTAPNIQCWGLLLVKDPANEKLFHRVGMGSIWSSGRMETVKREKVDIA